MAVSPTVEGGRFTVPDASESNTLGDYLRARRGLVDPADAGLPATGGTRRVPGLRREEVAMLAGVSANYYLRLEQGRDRHPSVQILESLARVLQLDDAATDYLLELATPRPPRRRRRPRPETVPASIRQLVQVESLPAFVEGRYYDVLVANDLARALEPNLRPGLNRLTSMFLDPANRVLYPDWDEITVQLVANFRSAVGSDTSNPRFVQLVGELSLSSERFRYLWGRHDVRAGDGMPMRVHHPQVGDFTLSRNKLAVSGTDRQFLVIYHAEPGSTSAEKLALLGSLATPAAEPDRQLGSVLEQAAIGPLTSDSSRPLNVSAINRQAPTARRAGPSVREAQRS